MNHFLLKKLVKLVVFITSRHRILGIRDWLASSFAVLLVALAAVSGWIFLLTERLGVGLKLASAAALIVVLTAAVAFVPIAFIIKLRRNGITDADYSVATGIDYKGALRSAHAGFQFLGIGASKLKESETELRTALDSALKNDSEIKMLLVDPNARNVFTELERMDGTTGYLAKAQGSIKFLQELAKQNANTCSIRLYRPASVDEVKPLRLFFTNDDCLVSPFSPKNGVTDQGRGLPQLRITAKGFPKAGDPTLYRPLKRYFDAHWKEQETKIEKRR
ncbi:hypothetical protein SAMN02787142_3273 [Burkholderia sp. WP9]|uniref:hypothetical protein n=1 Tax=Burkholderia sp. WP9 TaxID=1500263 RepID=UPI00089AC726|nr:hypothetical protein [Burkholderia sp. WP9]SED49607.1 hypothetical protein SAMN02787142_3273 [Burkholderia sp. WP9]